MTAAGAAQYALFLGIVLLLVGPVDRYLERVFERRPTALDPVLRPLERLIHQAAGVHPDREMDWRQYATAFLVFSLAGTLLLCGILRSQPPGGSAAGVV